MSDVAENADPAPREADARQLGERVLILAPTARDARISRDLLCKAGLTCVICDRIELLTREAARGAGAILLTEDAVNSRGIEELLAMLNDQPSWSELPVVMLMRGGMESPAATHVLHALHNVTLLERPAPMRTVESVVRAAVRARLRQYQIRDQIEEIRQNQRDRERLLESERAARTEAERANYSKDEFLATVSHELRTPLNAILGWTQILTRGNDDIETVREAAEVIDRNAHLQAQLIEDLLDMSRIISGKIRLDVQLVDPGVIVAAAIESVRPGADAKEIEVRTQVRDGVGPIRGDPGRLQQVLWNLLSNAVKFTPQGGSVTVALQTTGSHVEMRVSDSGQGMTADFIPYVFERFRQADASTTRKHGGLGLGLAIVKQLVELHGGTVTAESPGPGLGATFSVRLPFAGVRHGPDGARHTAPLLQSSEPREFADLTGLKVLVVDDDADARRLLKRLLTQCHAEVTTAASGGEALALLETITPHVLISDIGMPAMDGYEFIAKVRSQQTEVHKIPAAAVTAFARNEDKKHALHAGYQIHMTKPVEPAELIAMVANLGTAGKA